MGSVTDFHRIGDKIQRAKEENRTIYSFEYFPPKTDQGILNLFDRLDRMAELKPEWIDVTWGAGGSTSKATLDICKTAQNIIGVETMMHLTCTNMPTSEFEAALEECKANGIRNILALRGDPPRGQEWRAIEGGFSNAVHLVRFIREKYGDFFGIAVAGYPEKHQDAESYEQDLQFLKEKVDAGADVVITQLFYDVSLFLRFVADCRRLGIAVPIIPGIMPIQSYAGFVRMTTLCQTRVPPAVLTALEPIKDDDAAVKSYGVHLAVSMCREILDAGIAALHMYSLNQQDSVQLILEGLGLAERSNASLRAFPWRSSSAVNRGRESVRPIFWSNRTKSYQARTKAWEEFPNGRWGDVSSPAWGDLSDYHVMGAPALNREAALARWGHPAREADVFAVFAGFLLGAVSALPWNETALALESGRIRDALVEANEKGFLTINSQPRVAGAPSEDKEVGWGPRGGVVFQKAYVEFFCSKEAFLRLRAGPLKRREDFKDSRSAEEDAKSRKWRSGDLSWMAITKRGECEHNYPEGSDSCAVTWGVFPAREVVQPTVTSLRAFQVWREEAFALWTQAWGELYEEGSESRKLIGNIAETYYLVNIVDNNFMSGDIFEVFKGL